MFQNELVDAAREQIATVGLDFWQHHDNELFTSRWSMKGSLFEDQLRGDPRWHKLSPLPAGLSSCDDRRQSVVLVTHDVMTQTQIAANKRAEASTHGRELGANVKVTAS